jgi:hypothetical protein
MRLILLIIIIFLLNRKDWKEDYLKEKEERIRYYKLFIKLNTERMKRMNFMDSVLLVNNGYYHKCKN